MNSTSSVRVVREERAAGPVPLYIHSEWAERFPWLIQGTTGRGLEEPRGSTDAARAAFPGSAARDEVTSPFDLGLFGSRPTGAVMDRWRVLENALDAQRIIHSRQAHGKRVRWYGDAAGGARIAHAGDGPLQPAAPGLLVGEGDDGHATATPGLLLTVSVADCVPVFIVDADGRAIALVHAGWRGAAAGALEAGVRALARAKPRAVGAREYEDYAAGLDVHLGPAICGECYEVGPEVHEALGRAVPPSAEPVDLREALAHRAMRAGVAPGRITVSAWCTRCGNGTGSAGTGDRPFFSHRAGEPERQMAMLGIRE